MFPNQVDFIELTSSRFYIDKTALIDELEGSSHAFELILRPPGFMKTSLLAMLYEFYQKPQNKALFEAMAIGQSKIGMSHQGKHNVIALEKIREITHIF